MDEEDSNDVDHDSFYAILNVAKDASQEEVKRKYRLLAQACHPDKVSDPAAREQAAQNFTKIQEAYEVLGHEEKRTIYDIYGRKGLESGLEVGEHLRSRDELKQEFERFRAKQVEERQEASVAHRGVYVFKMDACELMNPYDRDVDQMPELISVATTNSVQIPLDEKTAASVGCQVAVRKKVGGGSFLCGLKRIVSEHDTVELHGAVGLKMFAQLQVTRRLSDDTSAVVTGTWQPGAGLGFTVSSNRRLGKATDAEWSWQVGPESTMGIGVTWRGEKIFLTGRLETGSSWGVVGKIIWRATASTSLRASARFGTMGIDLELGGSQQITEFSTAGCSVTAGVQGVVIKPRFSRGGHIFEVPILLSHTPRDYTVLAAAYVIPPLVTFVAKYYILKPLRKRSRVKKAVAKRMRFVKEMEAALQEAAGACRVMDPVASRKLRREVENGGLVIVTAKYGLPAAIREAEELERHSYLNGGQPTDEAGPSHAHNQSTSRFAPPFAADSDRDSDEDGAESPGIAEAIQAASPPMPDAWLDVTTAVRFMVNSSGLLFHKGVSKSGLMGFCDVALGEEKQLVVYYLWQDRLHSAVFADKAGGTLPVDGNPLTLDSDQAAHIKRIAEEQKLFKRQTGTQ